VQFVSECTQFIHAFSHLYSLNSHLSIYTLPKVLKSLTGFTLVSVIIISTIVAMFFLLPVWLLCFLSTVGIIGYNILIISGSVIPTPQIYESAMLQLPNVQN
jgi:hypothetical protein